MARAKKAITTDEAALADNVLGAKILEGKHDYHVQQALDAAWKAGQEPAVELPANVSLQEALAESGESVEDLKEEPAVPAKSAPRRAPRTGDLQLSEEMLAKVRDGLTRQGHGLKLGRDWYKAGVMAPSIRHAALEALCNAADEDGVLPMADALKALQPLKDAGLLGCSTPASRITKFIRSGHLLEA